MIAYSKQVLLFILIAIIAWACNESPAGNQPAQKSKYSIFTIDEEGNPYIYHTNDLSSGSVDPSKFNLAKHLPDIDRNLIVKEGTYYKLDLKSNSFIKYQSGADTLQQIGSFPLKDFYIENYKWLNADTLLLFDIKFNSQNIFLDYVWVNVREMKCMRDSTPIAPIQKTVSEVIVGFSEIKNNLLLIGYSCYQKENERYKTTDTTYIAAFEFPSIKIKNLARETRSVHPGGENTIEPGSFTDEKGDLYFLTCPGVALGNTPEKSTALLRIKKDEIFPDTSYFFNISASLIQNHAYSIYYTGNRKAIIRTERKDLFTSWDEHWAIPHFEFYLIDLDTQEISKLGIPLDKGTRRQCILQEGDIIYIATSNADGNRIWLYNLKTQKLSKGLELTGPTDFIMRLDRLY